MKYFGIKLITLLFFLSPCSGQIVKFKDGIPLGKRSELIASCVEEANEKMMNVNGFEVKSEHFCTCMTDELYPALYSWEFKDAMEEGTIPDLYLRDDIFSILKKCVSGNVDLYDDYQYGNSENIDAQRKAGIKLCIDGMMNSNKLAGDITQALAEEYCSCAIDKLLLSGLTYGDIIDLENENSIAFNELVVPCITDILERNEVSNHTNSYNRKDIIGGNYRSIIPLVDYLGQGYKIKINIAGVSKYYLFDTGASDLIIDKEIERELLSNGALKSDNYLNEEYYTLANNQTVIAQKVRIDNISIGDYTLNNVVLAIQEEGALLCGKGFLDKFKKWEFDKEKELLIIYK